MRGTRAADPPAPEARRAKPLTEAYLERAAAHYLDRYASSSENLRRVLVRKATRRLDPGEKAGPEVAAMVATVVERAVRSGLVDDRAYADMKVGSLQRRGVSTRAASARLRAKGVADETVAAALARGEPDEVALARRYAERKRLGPWRSRPAADARERDLAALCRAGFPYRVAKAALDALAEPGGGG